MQNFKQQFNAGLNADDDFELLEPGQYVNAENMRFGTTDKGQLGNIERIYGNQLVANSYLPVTGTNKCIGSVEDEENQRLIYFNYNSLGSHGIYCFEGGNIYKVLLNAQVTGGLNFTAAKDNYIHSAKCIKDLSYWTNNLNQPSKININSGIKLNHPSYPKGVAYTSPLKSELLTVIKRPPNYILTTEKIIDGAISNNFIKNFAGKFAIYFKYRDNEESVLSPYSQLVNFNSKKQSDDGYNAIDVTISLNEDIPQDIQLINISVLPDGFTQFITVKTWDVSNIADKTAIDLHIAGTTALKYRFYNDQTGIFLDKVFSNKQYESVPLLSQGLEIARNKLFLGDNLLGYDSPQKTSLTATNLNQDQAANANGTVFYLHWGGSPGTTRYVTNIPSATPAGFYRKTSNDTIPPTNPTNIADMTFISSTTSGVFSYYGAIPDISFYTHAAITITGIANILSNLVTYKSSSSYKLAVQFYDKYMRKSGVIQNELIYHTASRSNFGSQTFTVGFDWALSNTNRLVEIPDWAYYYSIVRTKCLRTNFFVQAIAKNITYVTKDAAGVYVFNQNTYNNTRNGLGINIALLESNGMGYSYSEGDMVYLYDNSSSTKYDLSVKGQDGEWLIVDLINLGTIGNIASPNSNFLFEIYTPFKEFINDTYYEVGNIYKVNQAETISREYSTLNGTLRGDVTIMVRTIGATDYLTENMSPIDTQYKFWYTDAARPCFIDKIGQQRVNNIVFSNVFIQGTKVNGLSNFEPLNVTDINNENGRIKKLILAQKVQIDGSVMLAICENETISCYLGETELFDTKGSAYTAKSDNTIGSIKALQGSMGTLNPESVFSYNGLVEWFDKRNGCFVQYSNNGLFPISKNKLSRAANLFAQTLPDNALVVGGNDPYHKEFLFSVPYTEAVPKGNLEDYSTVYPYDIYDGQAKTLVYKFEIDRWVGAYTYNAESFVRLGNKLYSFKGGNLYLHNVDTGTIYGNTFKSRLMLSVNPNPGFIKTFHSIAIEANTVPDFVHFRTDNPYVQSSDLVTENFAVKEGIITAPLFRDRLDPNATGTYLEKQMKAGKLFGKYLLVMVEYSGNVQLKFFNTSCTINAGHYLAR